MSKKIGTLNSPNSNVSAEIYSGFNWPCLFLGHLWFAFKKMWLWTIISLVLVFFTFGFTMLVFPFFANGLFRKHLISNDWRSSEPAKENPSPRVVQDSTNLQDWIMKAKPTPYWKFLLGANLFKAYQLDYVEKRGEMITVAVQSGKVCSFKLGEFKGKYIKTKEGNRDFTFKSTVGPSQKVTFRETLLQMPEQWWDELETKLGASESGLSKVLHGAKDILEDIS